MENQIDALSGAALSTGSSRNSISYEDALENHAKNTNWWTVFAAFDLPAFNSSPLWISKRTGVPVKEVVEALEGLSVLGYLRKVNESFVPVEGKEFLKIHMNRKAKAEVLEDHALISSQVLNHLHADSLAAVDHRCFAGNLEILQELYSDIASAFEKAYMKAKETPDKDRIFKMSFTAVDVLAASRTGKGS